MRPQDQLTMVKKDIGFKLSILKTAKHHKDNYTSTTVRCAREGLSLALRWKAELYQKNPELRPKVCSRQMSFLFKLNTVSLTVPEWLSYANKNWCT